AGDDDRADRALVEEQRAIAIHQLASTFATTRREARAKCRIAAAAVDWEIERRMMAPSAEERLVISALRDAAAVLTRRGSPFAPPAHHFAPIPAVPGDALLPCNFGLRA